MSSTNQDKGAGDLRFYRSVLRMKLLEESLGLECDMNLEAARELICDVLDDDIEADDGAESNLEFEDGIPDLLDDPATKAEPPHGADDSSIRRRFRPGTLVEITFLATVKLS